MSTLALDWRPAWQMIRLGDNIFTHAGPVPTRPEHDVAHLMIGANGGMPWRPQGSRDEVCCAEFNAVHLEVLLVDAGEHAAIPSALWASAGHVTGHMEWFAQQHYAPFPMPFGEALARFWSGLDYERLRPLVPLFWDVRHADPTQRIVRGLVLP